MPLYLLRNFLKKETVPSMLLLGSALLAILWANSRFDYLQDALVKNGLFFINDCLMTIFFFMVGRELKEGYVTGEFRHSQVILPAVGAIGGMLVPALVYIWLNLDHPEALKGWATPVATDIAFAISILTLLGKRVPQSLKLFLLALAIFDDLGAILIITFFFSHHFSWIYFTFILFGIAALALLQKYKVTTIFPYLAVGVLLWALCLATGIHPTLSGVIVALFLPYDPRHKQFEKRLTIFVAWIILPLFALANAGVSFSDINRGVLGDSILWGIIAGLFIGKQLGVFGFAWLCIKFRFAKLPHHSNWLSLYGVSILCGIGFTMSLFLGTLAFHNDADLIKVRLGVIIGSFLSSIIGLLVLFLATSSHNKAVKELHR